MSNVGARDLRCGLPQRHRTVAAGRRDQAAQRQQHRLGVVAEPRPPVGLRDGLLEALTRHARGIGEAQGKGRLDPGLDREPAEPAGQALPDPGRGEGGKVGVGERGRSTGRPATPGSTCERGRGAGQRQGSRRCRRGSCRSGAPGCTRCCARSPAVALDEVGDDPGVRRERVVAVRRRRRPAEARAGRGGTGQAVLQQTHQVGPVGGRTAEAVHVGRPAPRTSDSAGARRTCSSSGPAASSPARPHGSYAGARLGCARHSASALSSSRAFRETPRAAPHRSASRGSIRRLRAASTARMTA